MFGYTSWKQVARAYAVILVLGVVAFFVRFTKFDEIPPELQLKIFVFSLFFGALLWESLRYTNYKLNSLYPFERNLTGRITIQLVVGVAIGFLARFFLKVVGEPNLPFKLDSLFVAATWALYGILPVGINLGFFTVYFLERWKDSLLKTERLEKEKSQVQFDNLKNQLNPHFLFNALTSLNSLIFENQQLASEFVQQLSKVYRYVLQNKDKNFVLLETELQFITHYVKLLETRFQSALRIRFDIAEEAKEKAIVPVTLQILIENAIKHNVMDRHQPLTVEIVTIGDYLIVSNNLQLKKQVETSNKQGLENLKSLYQFLSSQPVIVEQTQSHFYVKVPLL